MNNATYYQKNREIILNRAKNYNENHKERLQGQARDKYRNLSEEDKNKKREYGKNRYHSTSNEKKQKVKEYQKKYRAAKRSKHNNEQNSVCTNFVAKLFFIINIVFGLIIRVVF